MRLAEVIGALTLAADTASGYASEKGLRTVIVASRLADRLSTSPEERRNIFWVTALRLVGCTAFSPESAEYAAGDDIGLRKTFTHARSSADFFKRLATDVAPNAPALTKATSLSRFLMDSDAPRKHASARCESATLFARTLGMSDDIVASLDVTGERFDGRGPRKLDAAALPLAARVADVADVVELFAWTGGRDLCRRIAQERSGRELDPELVVMALADLPELLAGLTESVWELYLAAESAPITQAGDRIDDGCVVLGRFADVKSRYTLTHSGRVAAFADAAGAAAALSDDDRGLLRRAAHVHDLGRVAVTTGTWDKRGPLNAVEWQRVRGHSHHTETILRGAHLDLIADVAGAVHERGGGAGYHKGATLDSVPLLAKIVAAADVFAALGEDRPHRPALDEAHAIKELRGLVERSELDARAVQLVLEARGVRRGRKSVWPAGLSDREVEVVRLVAVGRTNKEIGAMLGVSPRTAQKHVMRIYDKVGLESRAGLALYAMQHGLLDADRA